MDTPAAPQPAAAPVPLAVSRRQAGRLRQAMRTTAPDDHAAAVTHPVVVFADKFPLRALPNSTRRTSLDRGDLVEVGWWECPLLPHELITHDHGHDTCTWHPVALARLAELGEDWPGPWRCDLDPPGRQDPHR